MTGGQIGFYYHHHMPIPLDSHPKHLRRHSDPQGLFNATFKHEYSIIRLIHMTLILICHISGQYIQLTVCIYIYVYAYICMHIYIFMYSCTHTNTYIYISCLTTHDVARRWHRGAIAGGGPGFTRAPGEPGHLRPPAATCGHLRPARAV